MAYPVSDAFRIKEYSGESEFKGRLVIGNTTVPNEQLSKITIEDYIIDSSSSENNGVFYIGTFIAQKVIIKFKNLDGIELHSGDDASLFISQYVGNEWVEIPMGVYQVDELAENYHETCEINLLDYSTKFRKNIDYSPCFVDGKATIDTILQYVCSSCGVTLGTYPSINGNEEIGQFDSEVSGKRWISYIAELKGSNAKIGRDGHLYLIPLKHEHTVSINALESASWKLGEKYEISRVRFDNGVILYEKGDTTENTLYLRQDNPFILNQLVVDNIYHSLLTSGEEETEEGTNIDLDLVDDLNLGKFTLFGNTNQETTSGKNLFFPKATSTTTNSVTYTINSDGSFDLSGTSTAATYFTRDLELEKTYLEDGQKYTLSSNITIPSSVVFKIELYNGSTYQRQYLINNSTQTKTFTINLTDTTKIRTTIYVYNGNTVNLSNVCVQLEKGETKTNFEPYTNGASPNPDYSQEVEAVTGENEIDIVGKNLLGNTPRPTSQGITTTYDEKDGAFVLNGTTTADWVDLNNMTPINMEAGTYTLSTTEKKDYNIRFRATYEDNTNANFTIGKNGLKTTFTTNKKIIEQRIFIYESSTLPNTTFENERLYLQLEKGNQATDFEPYKKQSYEINLGKNLFDKTRVINNYYINSSGELASTNNISASDYMYIFGKSKITISGMTAITTSWASKCAFYDKNKNFISYKNLNNPSITHTIPNNAYYFRTTIRNQDLDTTQVETSESPTSYSPYFTPIELCKIGDYKDSFYYQSSSNNLFDSSFITTQTKNGISLTINNGLITIIGTATASTNIYYDMTNEFFNLENGETYTLSAIGTTTGLRNFGFKRSSGVDLFVVKDDDANFSKTTTINDEILTYNRFDFYIPNGRTVNASFYILLEKGSQLTEYQPYGSGWFIIKNIEKLILNGSESWNTWADAGNSGRGFYSYKDDMTNTGLETDYNNTLYCDLFSEAEKRVDIVNGLVEKIKHCGGTGSGRQYIAIGLAKSRLADVSTSALAVESFKTWLSNNNVTIYYQLKTPTYTKITDETLLEQLNALQEVSLYKGINHISQTNNDLPSYLQLDYAGQNQFEMYSLETRNYGDISLDAWDLIDYELGDATYTTYNNRKLTFEQSIMSDTNVQISNKQQEQTTNMIGGSQATQTRKLKTTVNALDNKITLEAEQINTNLNSQEGRISSLEISANGLSTTVSSLQSYTNDELNKLNIDFNSYKELTDDELGDINSKFDNYATKNDLITIENSVNTITTDTYTKTEINSFLVDGSVKKIQTVSLTADENGLSFDKTNAPTTSNINEKGVTVKDRNNNPILRAVYDDTIQNSIVETYRHQVHEYFIMGEHSRFEDYEDGTGCFYID